MNTVIMRADWFLAARGLSDKQYREFITKIAVYGFSECSNDVTSDDPMVQIMLEMAKPSVRSSTMKYLDTL